MSIQINIGANVSTAVSGINNVSGALATIPPAAARAQSGLNKVAPASGQATASLINLGRVVQDAPFGFIGIANNLNPLIEGFAQTARSAGGLRGGFAALGKSLMGGGGLALGISLVSAAMTIFGQRMQRAGKQAKDTKDELEGLAESLSKQAVQLTTLVGLVQNVNTSYGDKQKALRAINQEYRTYIENLGLEQINLNNVSEAYDKIIDSMVRQAVVKGIQGEITRAIEETAKALVTLQIEEAKHNAQLNKNQDAQRNVILGNKNIQQSNNATADSLANQGKVFQDAGKKLQQHLGIVTDVGLAQNATTQRVRDAQVATKDYSALTKNMTEDLKKQLAPLLSLVTSFSDLDIQLNKVKKSGLDPFLKLGNIPTQVFDPALLLPARASEAFTGALVKVVNNVDFNKVKETANLQLFNEFNKLFEQLGGTIPDIDITIDPVLNEQKLRKAFNDLKKFKELAESLGNVLSGALENFFQTIIEGGNAFQAFGNMVKQIMMDIISQLIQAAIRSIVLKAILGFSTGGVGSIVGAAGVRQAGGPVASNRSYLVGENGPEMFVPSTHGKVVSNNSLSSLAGQAAMAVEVFVTGEVKGRSLKLVSSRQEKYERRNS